MKEMSAPNNAISGTKSLSASNLPLWNGPDPRNTEIGANTDRTDNHYNFIISCTIVAENNCEYNAAKISRCTDHAGDNT